MKKRGRPLKVGERLDARLGFRIPDSLHERVLKYCDSKGISKSDFILESIRINLYVKETKQAKAAQARPVTEPMEDFRPF